MADAPGRQRREETQAHLTMPWTSLTWLNPPARAVLHGQVLEVTARPRTDFWQATHYGFAHDNGHFLGTRLAGDFAIEVTFSGEFVGLYDQAGLMLRAAPDLWLKAGVELSDGELLASAVVTRGASDWSVAPLPPGCDGGPITIRAERAGDSVTIRYRAAAGTGMRMLRLAYLPPDVELLAGPMCCSPGGDGLVVRFEPVRLGPPGSEHPGG
jgi:uncharacterized protein